MTLPGFPTSQTNETSPMDASTNTTTTTTTTTIGFSPQSQPRDNNIFSPLPPPPPSTLAAAPPLLHWPATNDTSDGGGFSSGSPLPSRDLVSYLPTTVIDIPKKRRTPRKKSDAASTSTATPRDNNIFSPLPPPPPSTLAAAPPFLHWPATNDTSDGGGFSSGSPLPSRDLVSYLPTTVIDIPKKRRTPRKKSERSWRGIEPASSAADRSSDEERQAANTLLMLANAAPRDD